MQHTQFFALTGGPGSGKTTLIDALAAEGFPVGRESGRAVIRSRLRDGGGALPDPLRFAEAMLAMDMATYRDMRAAAHVGPAFFDRGIPDIIGYLELCGIAPPKHFLDAARSCPYAPVVFAAPPWPDIYRTDAERRQDFAEAERTFAAVTAAWRGLGYRVEELPRAPPQTRLGILRDRARELSGGRRGSSASPHIPVHR